MAAPEAKRRSLRATWKSQRLFWLTVVLPTLLAIGYYGFIAADVYITESRFVVRRLPSASFFSRES